MDVLFVRVLLESQAATLRMSRRKTVLRTHGMKQKTEEEDCKSARKKWKRRGDRLAMNDYEARSRVIEKKPPMAAINLGTDDQSRPWHEAKDRLAMNDQRISGWA